MKKLISFILVLMLLSVMVCGAACKAQVKSKAADSTAVMKSIAQPETLTPGKGMADTAGSVSKPPKVGEISH